MHTSQISPGIHEKLCRRVISAQTALHGVITGTSWIKQGGSKHVGKHYREYIWLMQLFQAGNNDPGGTLFTFHIASANFTRLQQPFFI